MCAVVTAHILLVLFSTADNWHYLFDKRISSIFQRSGSDNNGSFTGRNVDDSHYVEQGDVIRQTAADFSTKSAVLYCTRIQGFRNIS